MIDPKRIGKLLTTPGAIQLAQYIEAEDPDNIRHIAANAMNILGKGGDWLGVLVYASVRLCADLDTMTSEQCAQLYNRLEQHEEDSIP